MKVPQDKFTLGFRVGLLLLYSIFWFRSAWLGDDAYITFRVVENFLGGQGLVWNVGERAQAYTHPLWMMMLTATTAILRRPDFAAWFLSVAASLGAVWIVLFRVARSIASAAFGMALLLGSKAFIDYSSSGLENPLTHLLLAICFVFGNEAQPSFRRLAFVSFFSGLIALNRMDLILLIAPPMLATTLRCETKKRWIAPAIAIAPPALWIIFSLFYYGFPFPNTAYAKLGTGLGRGELVAQGFAYLVNSAKWDWITLPALAIGILVGLYSNSRGGRAWIFGVILYLAYIVAIGGDFMSGRFLAAPFLIAVMTLLRLDFALQRAVAISATLTTLTLGMLSPRSPILSVSDYGSDPRMEVFDSRGISDERAVYYPSMGLLKWGRPKLDHPWTTEGKEAQRQRIPLIMDPAHGIGFTGYYAGAEVFIVDPLALSDPLLAQLPMKRDNQHVIMIQGMSVVLKWRPGHLRRAIPKGYKASLRSGENQIEDARVRKLYDAIRKVTRGGLWNSERFAEIWKLNTGAYRDCVHAEYSTE